jgi:hypothetical protein
MKPELTLSKSGGYGRTSGALMLGVYVVSLNCALLWLTVRPSGTATSVLALGNVLIGLGVLFMHHGLRLTRREGQMILIWSLCYCFTFYPFARWPWLMPLVLLKSGQAIAPTLAVFVAGDWRRSGISLRQSAIAGIALVVLIGIALTQSSLGAVHASLLFLFVGSCYVGIQSSARVLSRDGRAFLTATRVSLCNGIILCIILGVQHEFKLSFSVVRDGIFLGVFILGVQGLLLLGIRSSPAFWASTIISTSVPIAIVLNAAFKHQSPPTLQLVLGCLFVVLSAYLALHEHRKLVAVSV